MKSRIINAPLETLSVALALLLIETALRIQPDIAGKAFANGIRLVYRISEDGIYFMNPGFPLNSLTKPRQ